MAIDRMNSVKPDAGAHAAAIAAAAAAVASTSVLSRAWRFATSWCKQEVRALPKLPPGMQPETGDESNEFLERVYEMMKARARPPASDPAPAASSRVALSPAVWLRQDPQTIETFARFDEDSSGFISTEELEKVIMMLDVAPTKGDVATMIESMDLNKDGSVDFYEFCVHMQHLRDQRSASDVEYALDQAFALFHVDDENRVDEQARTHAHHPSPPLHAGTCARAAARARRAARRSWRASSA